MVGQHGVGGHRFDRRRTAATGSGSKRRGTNGRDQFDVSGRFNGNQGVARISGPLEGVRTFHRHQVTHLTDAEQCRHSRQQIFAESVRGTEHIVIAGAELNHLRRQHGSQRPRVLGTLDHQYFADASDGGHLRRDRGRWRCQHGDMNVGNA